MNNVQRIEVGTKAKGSAARILNKAMLICYLVPVFFLARSYVSEGHMSLPLAPQRTQDDYMLMVGQCLLALVVIHIPALAERVMKIDIPEFIKIVFTMYLFCAVFLGEVWDFYHVIPFWDSVLHTFSGAMLGFIACFVYNYIGRADGGAQATAPLLAALFVFCFSLAAGAIWELYEFAMDGIFGWNMQKAMLQSGELLSGHSALVDTMKDIALDTAGALAASLTTYSQLKHKKGWLYEGLGVIGGRRVYDVKQSLAS